jgi:two-component sensor histidine kinase
MRDRLQRAVRTERDIPLFLQLVVGVLASTTAVAIRHLLPLDPQQLPTITVVVAMAIVTTFVGAAAGITTAVVGGLASWYLIFNPGSFSLAHNAWVPLLGFAVIAIVIVGTASLYRSSERRLHAREVAELEEQAANAEFFAREMAHRLKNALAIVQAIAFQTLGTDRPEASRFAGRLRALADANELLTEEIKQPVADITRVLRSALAIFQNGKGRVEVRSVDASIPAQQVVSLALALHELGTNAVKYGALSTTGGTVLVTVEEDGDRLKLLWEERGGPPVSAPNESGFGTRLLQRSGINTELRYDPDGLKCSFGIRKAAS